MAFEMDDTMRGLWCVELAAGNWMGSLLTTDKPDTYKLVFRFRWYRDDKVFDSNDRRTWFEAVVGPTTWDESLRHMREIVQMVREKLGGNEGWELIRAEGEDTEAFVARLQQMPGIFMKRENIH